MRREWDISSMEKVWEVLHGAGVKRGKPRGAPQNTLPPFVPSSWPPVTLLFKHDSKYTAKLEFKSDGRYPLFMKPRHANSMGNTLHYFMTATLGSACEPPPPLCPPPSLPSPFEP